MLIYIQDLSYLTLIEMVIKNENQLEIIHNFTDREHFWSCNPNTLYLDS